MELLPYISTRFYTTRYLLTGHITPVAGHDWYLVIAGLHFFGQSHGQALVERMVEPIGNLEVDDF